MIAISQKSEPEAGLVLGIDAAWTEHHPSGVALITRVKQGFRIVRLGRSYEEFLAERGFILDKDEKPLGGLPAFKEIIKVASEQGRGEVQVIALDMPLSRGLITGRRACDNMISRIYGGRGASTHSPSRERPGSLSEDFRDTLVTLGFHLALEAGEKKAFFEVYPHASLIEMFSLEYRLPYKVGHSLKYWPALSLEERRIKRVEMLNHLRSLLGTFLVNLDEFLAPLDPHGTYRIDKLKGYEDLLDALVSALTGGLYLEKRIQAHGDEDGFVWVPRL